MSEMETATVYAEFANYRTVEPDPITGEDRLVVRTGRTGDKIEAPPGEIARLRKGGALDPPNAQAAGERALGPTDVVYAEPGAPVEATPPSLGRAPAGQVLLREDTAPAGGVVPVDTDLSDPVSVSEWISAEKPTAPEVVAAANGDPARAEAILEGERLATDGDPRVTVERDLQKVIDGSGA
jgi:hypothetical protein